MGRRLALTLVVTLAFGVAPAGAAAKSYYATPSPAPGATCTAESPCALSTALSTAATFDTVVIVTATYVSDEGVKATRKLTIPVRPAA